MADNRDLHERAVQGFIKLTEPITEGQWQDQTPCPDWKVKDLVGHVVGGNQMFAAIARGEKPTGEMPDGDLKQALLDSAKEAKESFAPDEINERMFELPFGTMPGAIAIGIHTIDVIVHSWDLAKSTGQVAAVDQDLAEAAWGMAQMFPETPELRGPGGPFGPKVDCPDSAPLLDRLVAHLGRTP